PPSSVLNTIDHLDSDRTLSGTTEIEGKVTDAGPGDVRSVAVDGGDLLVTGTLERTAPGAGFSLSATGILHITGVVRTTGGPVTLRASQIVISGTIETTGAGAMGDGNGVRGGP